MVTTRAITQATRPTTTDDTKSDGKLPATGAAVYGVSGAMVLLAAAGTALSIWRKRRA